MPNMRRLATFPIGGVTMRGRGMAGAVVSCPPAILPIFRPPRVNVRAHRALRATSPSPEPVLAVRARWEDTSNGYAEVKAIALRRAKLGDRVKFSERKHRVGPRARRSCSCNFFVGLCRWLKQSDLRSWINCSSHSASETERKPRSCALLSTGAAAAIASPSAGSLAPL